MKKIIVYLIILMQPVILLADIVYLRNGKILHGKIARQTLTKIELIMPDKKNIIIDKNEIQKIRYISEEELKRIQKEKELLEKKRQEELRKKQEELKRLEEEKKRKEEEQRRLEDLKRLEEEKKRKEEELKQLLELQKKQEEERKRLEESKAIETQSEIQQVEEKYKIQYQIGAGIGSFNLPLNQFYKYYNFLTDYSSRNIINYNQNLQIQMKSLPDWNWSGNIHAGISFFYKNHELGFLTKGIYQKLEPKSIPIPDKRFTNLNEPQYESYSENRFNQKKYQNLFNKIFIKIGTEEYISYFWHYIFPYFEIGFVNRDFKYNTSSNSTLLTSKRNLITDNFAFSNLIITETNIKNHLQQNAISLGIPFRFLMIFSSEFLFEFHYFILGKSKLNQNIIEMNFNDASLSNVISIQSDFKGSFSGNEISFIWQNTFYSDTQSRRIAYIRFSKLEFQTKFKNISANSLLIIPQTEYLIFNHLLLSPYSLLYEKNKFNLIKENALFFEFGIKFLQNL